MGYRPTETSLLSNIGIRDAVLFRRACGAAHGDISQNFQNIARIGTNASSGLGAKMTGVPESILGLVSRCMNAGAGLRNESWTFVAE